MSGYLYIRRLKCLMKQKQCIFWTLLFPVLLATLFHFAFSNLDGEYRIETIPTAVVSEGSGTSRFVKIMKNAGSQGGIPLFDVKVTDKEAAIRLLKEGKIKGCIMVDNEGDQDTSMRLYVKDSGVEETVLKIFLDQYNQTAAVMKSIQETNEDALVEGLAERLSRNENYLRAADQDTRPSSASVIYFYALIAMACMFGSTWGFNEVITLEADKSSLGARINASPVSKMRLLLSNFLAAFTIHFLCMIFLVFYQKEILKVDFGNDLGSVILVCFVGCLTAVSFGALVTILVKKGENLSSSILTAVTMLGSFAAGLMIPEVKYLIDEKIPFLSNINPAGLIADSLYSLFYYDTPERFQSKIMILAAMAAVFIFLTIVLLRRKEYASI